MGRCFVFKKNRLLIMNFYFEGWWHPKNRIGIDLMISEGMQVDFTYDAAKKYDWIVNLSSFDLREGHEGGYIFGPHINLPTLINDISGLKGTYYLNMLSNWLVELSETLSQNRNFTALPFAVDVQKFTPRNKNGKPFIYFKNFDKNILNDVKYNLSSDHIVIDYEQGYSEESFYNVISAAPYGIWIGRHESQGFAFQETMSCNTPIFVIDVESLRDEVMSNGDRPWADYQKDNPLKATAASYFDNRCGLISNPKSWWDDFSVFISNVDNYSPREFVMERLSPKACLTTWLTKLQNKIN